MIVTARVMCPTILWVVLHPKCRFMVSGVSIFILTDIDEKAFCRYHDSFVLYRNLPREFRFISWLIASVMIDYLQDLNAY